MRLAQDVFKQRTSGNTQAGIEVVENGEERSVGVQGHEIGPDEAIEGNDDDKEGVQPVDVLEPVGPSEGLVADVRRLLLGHMLNMSLLNVTSFLSICRPH